VGTSIANSPVFNFALDIMEIEGRPFAKRGKMSGAKQVYRCAACGETVVLPASRPAGTCPCGGNREALLKPLMKNGRPLRDLPPPRTIRDYVLDQLRRVPLDSRKSEQERMDF
jgi:nicotinate phosphoribosyltransferase